MSPGGPGAITVAALRALARGAAPLLLALVTGVAGAAANGPAEATMRVGLSGTDPEARAAFDAAELATRPRVLVVEIARIDNPGNQAVGIEVDLTWPGAEAPVRVGSFAPFPADMTGRYLLGTQRALAAVQGEQPAQPALIFRLTPVHGDLAPDFRVTLEAAWRQDAAEATDGSRE